MKGAGRAESLVLRWARIYTHGLDAASRVRRLEELASDCFEQRRYAASVDAPPVSVSTSMMARTLAGMHADLRWRHEQRAALTQGSPSRKGITMGQWLKSNWWIAIAAALGAMLTVLGIGLPFEDRTLGSVFGGIAIASLGIGMLTGIAIRRRNRRLGSFMIAAGTFPTFPFFWTIVLPALGLAVLIPALMDAADAERGAHPASPTA